MAVIRALAQSWSQTQTGLSTRWRGVEVGELAEVVATLAAERFGQRRARRREVQADWAAAVPPVGDNGTHRDSGQERGSDAASSGRLSAKRLAERGARVRRLTKDRQPRRCRVANWAPQTARLPTGNVTPATTATQARLGRWSWVLCDSFLPESRSPHRNASADRKWQWPGGVRRGGRRSAPRL